MRSNRTQTVLFMSFYCNQCLIWWSALSWFTLFRNMLHGPWKEAGAPVVTLHVDDKNVNPEAMAMSLAYLYGHYPKLNVNTAFRVLAAASFLDLQVIAIVVQHLLFSFFLFFNCRSHFISYLSICHCNLPGHLLLFVCHALWCSKFTPSDLKFSNLNIIY